MKALAAILALCAALPVGAGAPAESSRPVARNIAVPAALDNLRTARKVAIAHTRPMPRPPSPQELLAASRPVLAFAGPKSSLRPWVRPDSVVQQAVARQQMREKGAVCGDMDIQGGEIGDVPGKLRGCGIADAVRVRSVAGVTLSQAAVMDCPTARALKTWVEQGAKPAFRSFGSLAGMQVAAHYTCRTRNNQRGAKISEHGKGRAIDISAFVMRDGGVISVLDHWGKGRKLRRAYRAGCEIFGTTLGPGSDPHHRDHFHFDTARYRAGSYCGG